MPDIIKITMKVTAASTPAAGGGDDDGKIVQLESGGFVDLPGWGENRGSGNASISVW